MSSNIMLDAALAYAERGWHVFPLTDHSKIPIKGSAGVDDATIDRGQIDHWWHEYPTANIGISCGPSGLVVLDIDDYKAGADLTEWLTSKPELAQTMSVRTGSGGMHYYFLASPTTPIGNGVSKIREYVDHRGIGGYVLAPPSITDHSYDLVNDADPLPLPFWVKDALHKTKHPTKANDLTKVNYGGNVTAYGQKCLNDWNARMDACSHGRNSLLNDLAFAGGQVIAGGHLDEQTVRNCLSAAAHRSSDRGDHPLTDYEIEGTLTSGIEAGKTQPIQAERNPNPAAYAAPKIHTIKPQVRASRVGNEPPPPPPKLLWHGRIAIGALNLLAGTGGLGKSYATLKLAMELACGEGFGEGKFHHPPGPNDYGSTVVISYEDTEDDMRRRLWDLGWRGDGAAGCIELIDGGAMFQDANGEDVSFEPAHIDLLIDYLRTVPELRMVVIDPVMAFIADNADANQDNQVRASLNRLVTLARELDVAVIAVAHTRKGAVDWSNPADSVSGSVAFKNLARSVLMVMQDAKHEARKYIFHVKANHMAKARGIQYLFEDGELHWLNEVDPEFIRVLAARSAAGAAQLCIWWVEAYFAKQHGTPVRADAFVNEGTAEEVGWTKQQLRDAFKALGGIRDTDDRGDLWLRLPDF